VLRAKGCSSRIKFLNVRKKVRDWVGLNAIVEIVEILLEKRCVSLYREIEEWRVEMLLFGGVEIVVVGDGRGKGYTRNRSVVYLYGDEYLHTIFWARKSQQWFTQASGFPRSFSKYHQISR
jgi:hypothetical protein